MKAAVIKGFNQMALEDLPKPRATPGSFVIRVGSCTVCGSDLRILESGNNRVKYPAVIGHEIAGEIVEVGEGVAGYSVGDRVALAADIPCGQCTWCLNGMGNCCDVNLAMGYQFQGGFAEYCRIEPVVVRFGAIAKVPKNLPFEQASLAEPLACCINGLERVGLKPGMSTLIIGAGPIGIMLVKLARAFGSTKIILSDLDQDRLQRAVLAQPDVTLTTADGEAFVADVLKHTGGRGVDCVLVACASVDAQELSLKTVAKRGCINFFGGLPSTARAIQFPSNWLHYREASITGSHGCTPIQHALALDLIASKRVDLSAMVTHTFPLDRIHDAFAAAKGRAGLKVAVKP